MSSPTTRVALTYPIAEQLHGAADGILKLVCPDTSHWTETDFIENLKGFAGLLVSMRTPMNAGVLEALVPELRIVSSYTAGVENIDIRAAQRLGITVTNTGSIVAGPTAEITMLLIIGAVRRAGPSFELLRRGEWRGTFAHVPTGAELDNKTLGIIGMGGIGSAVAVRAAAFGMKVVYHNRTKLPKEREHGATYAESLEALLSQSDVVSLHCPLTDETRELINQRTLSQMKPGAVLINTARGGLLDEEDVIAALESNHLGCAGLDVYVNEPDINPYFLSSSKVFPLPHIGTATPDSRLAMERHALQNLVRFFSGEPVSDVLAGGS